MKIVIVYDSYFSNTEQIAQAIGASFNAKKDVEVIRVNKIKPKQLAKAGVLIIGSPTRAFRPTKAIVDFVNAMPAKGLSGVKVAVFDTRINPEDIKHGMLRMLVKMFGYAAKPVAGKLVKKGGELVVPPEGFAVKDAKGPLKAGEVERAAAWGKEIAKKI